MQASLTLLLDVNYLCHRAFFAMGGLSYNGGPTGVIFGILRDIRQLRDRFGTDQLVFCFDHGHGLREQAVPSYKASRRCKALSYTAEETESVGDLHTQVNLLKYELLEELGFRNVFYEEGYEADDVIASIIQSEIYDRQNEALIISGDKDLFQLLTPFVGMFDPRSKKLTTDESFRKEMSIRPDLWAYVKAIAGCTTDDVVGVSGVGEKTAIKYLNGELEHDTAAYLKIKARGKEWRKNLKLVELPYEGCPTFHAIEQKPTCERVWKRVAGRFGMKKIATGHRQRGLFDVHDSDSH